MISVLKSGLFSTIQDKGRYGAMSLGVPISGCMDQFSAQLANQLLQNDADNAILEITMLGPKLQFEVNTIIAITGADLSPKLNGSAIQNNKVYAVGKNDILTFGALKSGLRSYLAVKGGIKTERVLNSRSYFQPITKQNLIKTGDCLPIDSFSKNDSISDKYSSLKPLNFSDIMIDVFKGPEFHTLSDDVQSQLLSTEFEVSKLYNRMAYQLQPQIKNDLTSILTSPVLPGTVQFTLSGQLIVLMRDCQTTGGYPRIFQLTEPAINLLSQKKEQDRIRFNVVEF